MTTLILSLLMSISAHADFGFEVGSEITVYDKVGTVRVNCQGLGGFDQYSCRQSYADPGWVSKFRGPVNADADTLKLYIFQGDSFQKRRTEKYLGAEGVSKRGITLLRKSPFEKKFLRLGENRIRWEILKGGTILESGEIFMTLTDAGYLQCPWYTIYNPLQSECRSQLNACNTYFRRIGDQCQ